MMINQDKYLEFKRNYYNGHYPNERLGQAFLNKFFPNEINPDLFYAEEKEAIDEIEADRVDWNEPLSEVDQEELANWKRLKETK